ncbi:hypothetical protein [Paenimyroides aestuarii]|uniref:Uncharacterized protein n=1 Tax=Paenimyroides aestuarii TaxID=2968490 RepID=A0ABY5NRQ6_9FLAO|nr:hypothetical protein [Paenimyroides aestuarii]UUV21236.1 hypothetical protein NPX36_13045 [Paenimyroides aestuarii]
MFEFIKWVVIIIIAFAVLGFIFSKDGKREDGAKLGAIIGGSVILELLPIALLIFFVILIFKACT